MPDPSPAPDSNADLCRELLELCIAAAEDGDTASVTGILAAHPEHAQRVRKELAVLLRLGLLEAEPGPATMPQRFGDFRVIRELGSGGMGVVYLAVQESLGREVALKVLPPDRLWMPNTRERFGREIAMVARLQHPGIVPVHECGEVDGVPYFAMERVVGASLAEIVQQLAGRAPRTLDARALQTSLAAVLTAKGEGAAIGDSDLFRGSWPNAISRVVRDIARALEHAHDRGILHRDLKPSNALLCGDGRVVLIDFGLAQAGGDVRITRTGAALGSLPYMAPEQLRGDADAIDARTDVYALGITLYELLTLTLPFGDGSSGDTRERILRGDFVAPARQNPAIPADLDAICRQAFDADRDRRYASARAFAEDLQRYLDVRPVLARRPSLGVQVRRFARRSPWRALAVVLGLVLVVGGPLGFAIQQKLAADEIRTALDTAQRERDRAQRNIERAQDAVDLMLSRTASGRLANVPRTAALRRQLLEDALAFQTQILVDAPDSRRARIEHARSLRRMGSIRQDLGEIEQSITDLQAALQRIDELITSGVDLAEVGDLQFERGVALSLLGRSNSMAKLAFDRIEMSDRAILAFEAAATAAPHDELRRRRLVRARIDRAVALGGRRNFEAAEQDLGRVEELLGAQVPDEFTKLQSQHWFIARGSLEDARAVLLGLRGDNNAAFLAYDLAVQHLERAFEIAPDDPQILHALAGVRARMALLAHQNRDWDRALPLLDEALELRRQILRDEPDDPSAISLHANMLGTRADTLGRLHRYDEAAAGLLESLAIVDDAIERFPEIRSMRERRAALLGEYGQMCERLDDLDVADEYLQRAADEWRALATSDPQEVSLRGNFSVSLAMQANVLARRGELRRAQSVLDEAIEVNRSVTVSSNPRHTIDLLLLASELAKHDRDLDRAKARVGEARDLALEWFRADPADASRRMTLASLELALATIDIMARDLDAAQARLEAAIPEARLAAADGNRHALDILGTIMLRVADCQLRSGHVELARESFVKGVLASGVTRDSVSIIESLVAMFDRPDFAAALAAARDGAESTERDR